MLAEKTAFLLQRLQYPLIFLKKQALFLSKKFLQRLYSAMARVMAEDGAMNLSINHTTQKRTLAPRRQLL